MAFSALEAEFKVLKRCVGHWATEAIFEAHYEYHRNKVGGSSLAFRMLTPQIVSKEKMEDNMGSIALAKNPVFHKRTKHIDV